MTVESYPSSYIVTAVPDSYGPAGGHHYAITVTLRAPGQWAVEWFGLNLGRNGKWRDEPSPSQRTDYFKKRHRFDLETALGLAKTAAPLVVVNGRLPHEFMAYADDVTAREASS